MGFVLTPSICKARAPWREHFLRDSQGEHRLVKVVRMQRGRIDYINSGSGWDPAPNERRYTDSPHEAGGSGSALSSARYKRGIEAMGNRSKKMLEVGPVTFACKDDGPTVEHDGLIAEEVGPSQLDLSNVPSGLEQA